MGGGFHFSIPTAPDGAPTLSPDEEEAWMEERRRSLARMRARREKRREIGPAAGGGGGADLYEPALGYSHGSDSDSGSVSAQGSWTSSVEKRELAALVAQRERERERDRKRRAAAGKKLADAPAGAKDRSVHGQAGGKGLGLHVSNPDDPYDRPERERPHRKHHGSMRVHVAHHESPPEWEGGTPNLAYINELGRREDGYDSTADEGPPATYSYRRD
ncbi:hypothetical protein C2E23DRAFT_722130 [Lenzites betulinus]|nr:hypothetical protein C2E23DRAFT_722130 [Lenzites betulinus]